MYLLFQTVERYFRERTFNDIKREWKSSHLPHEALVYPPNMYFPATRTIVTVGPLPSHNEWNVVDAQPSTDASQQRFQ